MSAPETQIVLANQVETLFPEIEALTVADDGGLAVMTAHMVLVKDWLTKWDAHHDPVIESAKETLRLANAAKNDEHRAAAERTLKYASTQSTRYVIDRDARIKEQNRQLELKANQDAQKDRAKEIARLEKQGAPANQVKAVERAPLAVAPPPRAAAIEKPKGLVTTHHWSAVPDVDESAGIIAILKALGVTAKTLKEKAHLLKYLEANTKSLNSEARSAEHQFSVPGWHSVDNPTSHTRS